MRAQVCIAYTARSRQVIFQNNLLKIAGKITYTVTVIGQHLVRIAARVCAPQSQFLYIINRMILKNDSNAVLITLVLSWVNNLPTNSPS